MLDNICRYLGWLGERLLAKGGPEVRPIMHDSDYETEFDSLMNALLGIGSDFTRRRRDKYPLIFFDALYVVARGLMPHYSQASRGRTEIRDSLFSLMYEKERFAEAAMRVRNADAAALAVLRLKEDAVLAQEAGNDEQLNQVINSLLDLGVLAASLGSDLPKSQLSKVDLATDIKEAIAHYANPNDLAKEAREVLIKFRPDVKHDVARAYVTEVGAALGVDWEGRALYEGWQRGSRRTSLPEW